MLAQENFKSSRFDVGIPLMGIGGGRVIDSVAGRAETWAAGMGTDTGGRD